MLKRQATNWSLTVSTSRGVLKHFGGVIYSDMFKTFALVERIRQEVEALGALAIIVDTSVGYFEGGDANVRATPRA
jgi:hypothetical protein